MLAVRMDDRLYERVADNVRFLKKLKSNSLHISQSFHGLNQATFFVSGQINLGLIACDHEL